MRCARSAFRPSSVALRGFPSRWPPCETLEATPVHVTIGPNRSREEAMAKGLLFASFDFTTAHADEFHDWYDLEHIPERLRVPGFINAERWIGDENPNITVATYDLDIARRPAERALQGDRLRELVGLDQARHGDGAPHHALHRRAACAGRPRRTLRRRRAAGRVDECRSGSRARIQRMVQRRAPAAARRGAGRAVRAPLQLVRSRIASANTWRCIT